MCLFGGCRFDWAVFMCFYNNTLRESVYGSVILAQPRRNVPFIQFRIHCLANGM